MTTYHSHGDPSVTCTIASCRYPQARFLCGATRMDWVAGMREGLCVLPSGHSADMHADELGNQFGSSVTVINYVIQVRREGRPYLDVENLTDDESAARRQYDVWQAHRRNSELEYRMIRRMAVVTDEVVREDGAEWPGRRTSEIG